MCLHKKSDFPPEAVFLFKILRGYTAHPFHKKHKRMIINPITLRLSVKKGENIANPETSGLRGAIFPLFFDIKHQISFRFATLITKTTCYGI
jgi:hypothetical protein